MNKAIWSEDEPNTHVDWCLCEACEQFRRDQEDESEDTGRYEGGYRTYRSGVVREDFGADR